MRLFVALPVPSSVRDRLHGALAGLPERYPDLRWTRPEGWHVTLAFLGEVADERADDVAAVVDRVVTSAAWQAPTLRLGEPGAFGRSTAWVGVHDEPVGAVPGLGEALQTALAEVVAGLDPRPVHPHLTLARTRRRDRLPRHLLDDVPRVDARWSATEVVVYRSRLGRGGATYEELSVSAW